MKKGQRPELTITVRVDTRGEKEWRPQQAMTVEAKERGTASGGGASGVGMRVVERKG